MNYLFTFTDYINPYALVEFDMFCRDLGVEDVLTYNASDNDEGAEFPPNFIMVLVDTDDKKILEQTNKEYNRILTENAKIMYMGKRKGHLSLVKS